MSMMPSESAKGMWNSVDSLERIIGHPSYWSLKKPLKPVPREVRLGIEVALRLRHRLRLAHDGQNLTHLRSRTFEFERCTVLLLEQQCAGKVTRPGSQFVNVCWIVLIF